MVGNLGLEPRQVVEPKNLQSFAIAAMRISQKLIYFKRFLISSKAISVRASSFPLYLKLFLITVFFHFYLGINMHRVIKYF